MGFYRTMASSIHEAETDSIIAAHANILDYLCFCFERSIRVSFQQNPPPPQQPTGVTALSRLFPSIAVGVHPLNGKQAYLSSLYRTSFVFTLHAALFPWRNNSSSTAAAPPIAAAITPVCCGKSPFFAHFPQLSSSPAATKKRTFPDSLLY
jgi:hypothetical protein